ncbi:YitT family protein [Paenibacillus donghaensis]|uniref:YitT family protein n=1 Tax=Paenibacillus donghaensis TaxID=414771 RepID=UPI001883D9BD|nr:YitT family protein [Paenibacillus donghaensis]MBE9916638.1 YitT family protein [Paenibacillus donghaensis]
MPQIPVSSRRKAPAIPASGTIRHVVDITLIVIGSLAIALGFNLFLLPNGIAAGGVSGISVLFKSWFGLEPAFTQWAMNIPIFFLGLWLLGKSYGLRSLLGSVILPLFVFLTKDWPLPTDNPLLASIYGGIAVGLGVGIVYRGRGSTGGLATMAQIIQKYSGLSFSLCVVMLDGSVILLAACTLSLEKALYALVGLYVTGKVIDMVELGFSYSKVAYIISNHTERISEAILHDLDRGLTKLSAQGGYTGESRTVLMVVIGQSEATRLKTLVRSVDPDAFVIISNTHEVLGEGFKWEA